MPVKKRATTPPQFAQLLLCFPCPAWIENSTGKILARNAHSCSTPNQRLVKSVACALPPAGNTRGLRLIALFPARQETACQRRIISALLARTLHPEQAATDHRLTPREREIYCELSQGCSYKTIAENLGISHATIRWHIARIRRKLGTQRIPILRQKNPAPPQPKPT